MTWCTCPTCWGQGRLLRRPQASHLALVCPTCLGVGEIARGLPDEEAA